MELIVLVEDGAFRFALRDDSFVSANADDFICESNWTIRNLRGKLVATYYHEYQNLFAQHVITTMTYTVDEEGHAKLVRREKETGPEEVLIESIVAPNGVNKGLLVLHEDNDFIDGCDASFLDYPLCAERYDSIYERYILSRKKSIKIFYNADDSVIIKKGAGTRSGKKAACAS